MRCVFPACNHESSCNSEEITFFPFPKEPYLRKAWLKALHKEDWNPDPDEAVCSSHFLQEYMSMSRSRGCILHRGALPVVTVPIIVDSIRTVPGTPSTSGSNNGHDQNDSSSIFIKKENDSFAHDQIKKSDVNNHNNTCYKETVVNRLKTVTNLINRDEDRDYMVSLPRVYVDVVVDSIKTEKDITNQDNLNIGDNGMTYLPSLHGNDIVDSVKKENVNIEHEINDKDELNDNVIYLPNSDENTATTCVKIEDHPQNLVSISVESVGDSLKPEEVAFKDDSLLTETVRKKAKKRSIKTPRKSKKKKRPSQKTTKASDMFCCELCPFETNREDLYSSHLKSHTASNFYSCTICNYKTYFRSRLTYHVRVHTNEKPYSCNVCSMKFLRETQFKAHFLIHSKPYACNVCNRKFTERGGLEAHLIVHLEKKPWNFIKKRKTSLHLIKK